MKPIKHTLFFAALTALVVFVPHAALRAEAPSGGHGPATKAETLLQTNSSWDGVRYERYPAGQPQLSVLKITIPPHTALPWHTHAMPNVAYVLSGALRVETREGKSRDLHKGDVLAETVDTVHRGVTGDKGVVLIVFYAGTEGMPLSAIAQ